MRRYLFRNNPSPAIVTQGLHKPLKSAKKLLQFHLQGFLRRYWTKFISSIRHGNNSNDESTKCNTSDGKSPHSQNCIKLWKVMKAFRAFDLAKDLVSLTIRFLCREVLDKFIWDQKPLTSEDDLGHWDIVLCSNSPRRISSTIKSVYDNQGFLAPVLIQGKFILLELTTGNVDWDESLPKSNYEVCKTWNTPLVTIQQMCLSRSFTDTVDKKLQMYMYWNTSERAITSVAYSTSVKHWTIGFVLGKAKVDTWTHHSKIRLMNSFARHGKWPNNIW